ncbi:MAG: hypothetical protein OXF28_00325 [Thaumarchaeota archaeon]|nr:hypothetical protein [Nitrososphaerota archaeon]MCY3975568.1 hypothetical protein [Nitrososphaerota archaeon]
MGIIAKGIKCDVNECQNDAIRSLSINKIDQSNLHVTSNKKHAALCKLHYKEWKKDTKKSRLLELSRYDKH